MNATQISRDTGISATSVRRYLADGRKGHVMRGNKIILDQYMVDYYLGEMKRLEDEYQAERLFILKKLDKYEKEVVKNNTIKGGSAC